MSPHSAIERHVRTSFLAVSVINLVVAAIPCQALTVEQSWYSKSYHGESGLSVGTVSAITQDADGFLWLGTDAGLIRFDGLNFATWGAHGEPNLPDDYIGAVLSARDRSLWIGFRNGMVSRIDRGAVRTFTPTDGLPGGYITKLIEDGEGAVWVATRGGLARFRSGQWETHGSSVGLPAKARIYTLRIHADRSLWIASAEGLFRRTDPEGPFELVWPHRVRDLVEDGRGGFWITDSHHGFGHLDAQWRHSRYVETPRLMASGHALLQDSHGDLWIGTLGQGLWRTMREGGTLLDVRAMGNGALDNEVISTIFEDREGGIWVGGSGGLTRFFRHDVRMITRRDGLTNDIVLAVSVTPNGTVWISAPDGLNRFDAGAALNAGPRTYGFSDTQLFALNVDSSGVLWVGTEDGFGTVARGRFSKVPVPDGIRLGAVTAIGSDRGSAVWLCHSGDRWLSRWDGRALTGFLNVPQISGKECTTVYSDRSGRVWIGFADGTLAVHQGGAFRVYSESDGLPAARISAIHEDAAGTLWIATGRGLSRFRNQAFETLTARNGLPSDGFNALVEDLQGKLWLSFASGIVRLDKTEIDTALVDESYRVPYFLLDSSDGLRGSPVRLASPTSARGNDGALWFTTAGGVAVVHPEALVPTRPPDAPKIIRIVADGRSIASPGHDVSFDPRVSMLQIDYTAVSLSAASKVRFRYMLQGLDKDWVTAGSRRQAFYTNLPPRRYRFLLGASIDGGEQSLTEWSFDVQPAFHQTRLFFAVMLLGIVGVLTAGWWLRLRMLRMQFDLVLEERVRVGREVHDTVLQSLAATALQLEGIAKNVVVAPAAASTQLRHVRRQVEQYIYEARQSILELRSPTLEKRPLSDAIRESGEHLLADSGSDLSVVVSGTPRQFSRDVEFQLLRIAQEALRNAARHGAASRIQVELVYGINTFGMNVSDNGRGFRLADDCAPRAQRWGLVGMRERSKRIGGTFSVTSAPGQGTEIHVTIPAG